MTDKDKMHSEHSFFSRASVSFSFVWAGALRGRRPSAPVGTLSHRDSPALLFLVCGAFVCLWDSTALCDPPPTSQSRRQFKVLPRTTCAPPQRAPQSHGEPKKKRELASEHRKNEEMASFILCQPTTTLNAQARDSRNSHCPKKGATPRIPAQRQS